MDEIAIDSFSGELLASDDPGFEDALQHRAIASVLGRKISGRRPAGGPYICAARRVLPVGAL